MKEIYLVRHANWDDELEGFTVDENLELKELQPNA